MDAVHVAGLVGSPMIPSRSERLVEYALSAADLQGARTTLINLKSLPADALLGRRDDPATGAAIDVVLDASIVIASTPTYRASYSGLLKCFLDLLPDGALAGRVAVPMATGADHDDLRTAGQALRAVFQSLGASIVTAGAYAVDTDFKDGVPSDTALKRVSHAVAESIRSAQHLTR